MAGGEKETGKQVQNHSGVYDNAQCSQDLWKNSVNKSEWKEFSRELHEWASLKEKSHTWNKSCTDSSKGGGDILGLPAGNRRQGGGERGIKELLKQLRKGRKGEDEARALPREMQINLEEAQARASATELEVFGRFDE